MVERAIAIKLTVKDQETILAALRGVGKEAEQMVAKFEAANKRTAAGTPMMTRALGEAKASAAQLYGALSEVTNGLGGLAPILSGTTLMLGGVAVAVGVLTGGLVKLFEKARHTAEWADNLQKFASSVQATTGEIQAWEFAARSADVSAETFRESLKGLQAKMFEAAAGIGRAKEIFKQLGIEIRDSQGNVRPTLDLLRELMGVIGDFDRADRTTILRKLDAASLGPLLKEGSEGVDRLLAKFQDLGLEVESGTVRHLAKMNDELRDLQTVRELKVRQAFAEWSPALLSTQMALNEISLKLLDIIARITNIKGIADLLSGRAAAAPGAAAQQSLEEVEKLIEGWEKIRTRTRQDEATLQRLRQQRDVLREQASALQEIDRLERAESRKPESFPPASPPGSRRLMDPEATKQAASEYKKFVEDTVKLEQEAARKVTLSKFDEIEVRYEQEVAKAQEALDKHIVGEEEAARHIFAAAERRQGELDRLAEEGAIKQADALIKEHERAAKDAERIWHRLFEDLASALIDSVLPASSRSPIERALFRFAGGLLQREFNPLLSGLGLAQPIAGAENSPLHNIGRSLSGISIGGVPLWGSSLSGSAGEQELVARAAQSAGQPIPGGTGLVQGAIGGLATGVSIGSLAGMIPGLNAENAQIGGAAGGTIGAVVGSIIPGVGTVIGGLIGSILGSGAGLFGPKKPSVGPGANAALGGRAGRAYVEGVGADNGGNAGAARQFGDAFATAINRTLDALGLERGKFGGLYAAVTPSGFRTGIGLEDMSSGTDAEKVITDGLFKMLRQPGRFFDLPADIAGVVAKSSAADLEGLLGDIEFAKNLDDIVDGLTGTEDQLKAVEVAARDAAREQVKGITEFAERARRLGFEEKGQAALDILVGQMLEFTDRPEEITETAKALAALAATFKVVRESAEDLGITEQQIAAAEQAAKDELRKGFDEGIAQQILTIVDPVAAALDEFDRAAEKRMEEARLAGADLVEVERLTALQRQQVIEQAAAASQSSLQRFWEEITFGGLSGVSPITSLEGTRASFVAAAAQGDRGRIEDFGRQLLTQSRGAFASGSGFQSDLDLVRGIVEPLVLANDNAVVNAINASGAENTRYQAQIVARLGELAEENAAMKEEIARLNSMLQRLLVKAA